MRLLPRQRLRAEIRRIRLRSPLVEGAVTTTPYGSSYGSGSGSPKPIIAGAQAEQWHLKRITKPHLQHGTYSFFFWDCDDNCWEILTNPEGGYSWLFEQGD